MGRQILVVVGGLLLGYLVAEAYGYALYNLTGQWPLGLPPMSRFLVALAVGAFVGGLAAARPTVLTALSLAPVQFSGLILRGDEIGRSLGLGLLYVFVGMVTAASVFAARERSAARKASVL